MISLTYSVVCSHVACDGPRIFARTWNDILLRCQWILWMWAFVIVLHSGFGHQWHYSRNENARAHRWRSKENGNCTCASIGAGWGLQPRWPLGNSVNNYSTPTYGLISTKHPHRFSIPQRTLPTELAESGKQITHDIPLQTLVNVCHCGSFVVSLCISPTANDNLI